MTEQQKPPLRRVVRKWVFETELTRTEIIVGRNVSMMINDCDGYNLGLFVGSDVVRERLHLLSMVISKKQMSILVDAIDDWSADRNLHKDEVSLWCQEEVENHNQEGVVPKDDGGKNENS